jgi:predicted transcriptional regulator|tara:strand:+ start:1208 stop:1591 length:384 start_codon:yes stop_codon:yes gene_type:complete
MKIKNITVEIKPLKAVLRESAEVMGELKRGKSVKPQSGLSFGSVESFREFFTPKRIELLQVIKHKQPHSVYELAKLTKREIKSIVVDINILSKYGLIDMKKVPVKGRTGYKLMPIFDYDKLTVDIAM